jgi:hypothetical protein
LSTSLVVDNHTTASYCARLSAVNWVASSVASTVKPYCAPRRSIARMPAPIEPWRKPVVLLKTRTSYVGGASAAAAGAGAALVAVAVVAAGAAAGVAAAAGTVARPPVATAAATTPATVVLTRAAGERNLLMLSCLLENQAGMERPVDGAVRARAPDFSHEQVAAEPP